MSATRSHFSIIMEIEICLPHSRTWTKEFFTLHFQKIPSTSDGVSIHLFNFIFPYISNHLLRAMNTVFMISKFHKKSKIAKIRPIPKKSFSFAFNNLRPISMLPGLSQITERIMKEQLDSFLNNSNAMHYAQFGFRSGRCTSKLLISLTGFIRDNISLV